MNRSRVFALSVLSGFAVLAAHADTFNFSYTGALIAASGTFTGSLTQSPGVYQITAVTGMRNGVLITGLDSAADYADQFLYYPATDTGTATNPAVLDNNGVAYLAGGKSYNVYASDVTPTLVENDEFTQLTNFSVVQVASTPEPSSLVLLGSGLLSAVGLFRRRLLA